jgi:tripeptidyl-peptidase-1
VSLALSVRLYKPSQHLAPSIGLPHSTPTMALRNLLAILSIVAAACGSMVVHESRPAAPDGFTSQGPAPPDDVLTLRVALAGNNVAGLEEKLMSVSTPGSPEFRQWLSMEEVCQFCSQSDTRR